jgi:formamidopyrimidine-DNA glycosylase
MPELPEVETVVRNLNNEISSKTKLKIIDVNVFISKIIKNLSINEFKKKIIGEQILNFERNGKYIILKLSNKKNILIHLRMEGKLFLQTKEETNIKKVRVQFTLSNGMFLNFFDTRMFGTFHFYLNKDLLKSNELKKVGIDVLDKKFNNKYLFNNLKNRKIKIKTFLLNQTFQAGIGNIYADEILFDSRILPTRNTKDISLNDCEKIIKSCKKIIVESIKEGGTTVNSFKSSQNKFGKYQDKLMVYHQKMCKICKHKIRRIKINGRTS